MKPEKITTACSLRTGYNDVERPISDIIEVVTSDIVVTDHVEALIVHRSATRRRWGMARVYRLVH